MPTTIANKAIADSLLAERYKNSHIKAVIPILNVLSARIETLILRIDVTKVRDINAKIREINSLIDAAFAKIQTLSVSEYRELVEAVFEQEEDTLILFFGKGGEEKVQISDATKKRVASLALATLAVGKTFKTQIRELKTSTKNTIAAQVRRGIDDGQDITTAAKSVRGTRSKRFKDGTFNTILRNMDAVVRTSITGVVNKAKIEYYRVVGIDKYIWISVLDSNTSAICRGRSNKVYVVGLGPIPPAHYRCRSTIAPYKPGMKIPTSYGEWLRSQPLKVIEEALGKTKAQMFLTGKVKIDKFVSRTGDELTIKELRSRRP